MPFGKEDELRIGDCVVDKPKAVTFKIVNQNDKDLKFRWNCSTADEFTFYPTVGHIKAGTSKTVKVMVRGKETKKYEKLDFTCETSVIEQNEENGKKLWNDWDDTMKTLKLVRPSEFKRIERLKEIAEIKRKED